MGTNGHLCIAHIIDQWEGLLVCMQGPLNTENRKPFSVVTLILLGAATGALAHYVYFLLAPNIWAQQQQIPISSFTPWYRYYAMERDGVEVYALYGLTLVSCLSLPMLSHLYSQVTAKSWRVILNAALLIVSGGYFASIGFHPPMSTMAERTLLAISQQSFYVLLATLPTLVIFYLFRKNTIACGLLAGIVLLPACFIATGPAYWPDYGYILAPALRILNGASLSEVYLQYDLFLSLLAAITFFFHLDVDTIQVFGQTSFFLLFLGIFLLARKLFLNKNLAPFLLISLILVRIYGGPEEPLACFQVTPLRLDLWFLILLPVYFKGPHHWLSGLVLGLMLIIHRNFGIIYLAAYCQLLATLLILDYGARQHSAESKLTLLKKLTVDHLHYNWKNLLAVCAAYACSNVIFSGNSAFRYQKIGVGFMQIATNSFYWYLAILLTLTMVILVKMRTKISHKQLVCGFFLLYLTIGNSLYFFGRSHENNILNLSAIFLFLFFLTLDLMQHATTCEQPAKSALYDKSTLTVALGVVILIALSYGDVITDKVAVQRQNFQKSQFIYPNQLTQSAMERNINGIRSIIGDSSKVYFVSELDFFYYYYGRYEQSGYYNPFLSWTFSDDMTKFINDLLAKGYYIVVDKPALIQEAMPDLHYSNLKNYENYAIFWQ